MGFNMKFSKVLAIIISFFSLSASALDSQFICSFGNTVKIASKNTINPQPIVEKSKNDRFTFVIDSVSPFRASYINLNNGLNAPLHATKNGSTYIFVESNYGGNQFLVSIFTEKKLSDGYNAVMSFHNENPTDSDDFFAQSIRIGRCY